MGSPVEWVTMESNEEVWFYCWNVEKEVVRAENGYDDFSGNKLFYNVRTIEDGDECEG